MKSVPNYENYVVTKNGDVINTDTDRTLKRENVRTGYQRVTLCDLGIAKRFLLHRLVASVYLDNPDMLREVNHKDMDKTNNSVGNLEWCSSSDNKRHARRLTGQMRAHNSSLTDEQARVVCELLQAGWRICEIHRATPSISKSTLGRVKGRTRYLDISCDYKW